jgi:hypothetical protein
MPGLARMRCGILDMDCRRLAPFVTGEHRKPYDPGSGALVARGSNLGDPRTLCPPAAVRRKPYARRSAASAAPVLHGEPDRTRLEYESLQLKTG